MTMAEIRAELHELAIEHGMPRLSELAEETKRKFNGRAPNKSRHLTAADKRAVRAFARTHPDWHLQDVANTFNVNLGRVSEIVHGKRA